MKQVRGAWKGLRRSVALTGLIAAVTTTAAHGQEASATPLSPPDGVTAVPGSQQVTVTWQPSTGANGYVVLRWVGDQTLQPVTTSVTAPPFVDTGLTNGTLYVYRVEAMAPNFRSMLSTPASATPADSPPVPPPTGAPTLSATGGDGFVDLSWTAVTGATGYKVFKVVSGAPVLPPLTTVTSTSFRHQPLTDGTSVSYQVAATNSAGDSPLSNVASATPTGTLAAPTNLSAVGGNAMITLSWTAVSGVTSYRVYRGVASNAQGTTPLSPNPTTAGFVDNT